jgi:hypothetical protein
MKLLWGSPALAWVVLNARRISCPSCEIAVLDMKEPFASRAKSLGIHSVSAVVVDGNLANCCTGRGPDEAALRAAGIGQPL